MLRGLTAKQLWEWEHFADIEPFDERRQDWRVASILSMLANVNRDSDKRPEPFTAEDFMLLFGDARQKTKKSQTWQEQKRIFEVYAEAFK